MSRSAGARHVDVDAVVVGGGAAGMVAARDLARAGASVALLDEHHELGGQYYRRRSGAVLVRDGDLRPRGTRLAAEVRAAGVAVHTATTVWGVGDDRRTVLATRAAGDGVLRVRGTTAVVATGAHERSVPFPGWQLPGVVTPGCALHLATIDRVPVGRRTAVAGSGPFLLPVACALLDVGVEVVGVFEAGRPYRPDRRALDAARYPRRLVELGGYLARLARAGVRVHQGWHVAAAHGDPAVEGIRLRGPRGREREIAVDAAAVGFGFRPNTELLALFGAEVRPDPATWDLVPVCDELGRTSVPGLVAAGEARGVAGVHAATVRGALAAVAAAEHLGLRGDDEIDPRLLRRARAADAFARLTAARYPVPHRLVAAAPDATLVCRCEGVTAGEVRAAAATGWNDMDATKGASRAGMGPCQGRQCAYAVAELVRQCTGTAPRRVFSPQMPLKPVRVAELLAGTAPSTATATPAVPAPPAAAVGSGGSTNGRSPGTAVPGVGAP